MGDDSSDDLGRLAERIHKAKETEHANDDKPSLDKIGEKNVGMAAGGQFLSYVIAGWILGYFLDGTANSRPWLMILGLLAGFGLGVYHANKTMNKKS